MRYKNTNDVEFVLEVLKRCWVGGRWEIDEDKKMLCRRLVGAKNYAILKHAVKGEIKKELLERWLLKWAD